MQYRVPYLIHNLMLATYAMLLCVGCNEHDDSPVVLHDEDKEGIRESVVEGPTSEDFGIPPPDLKTPQKEPHSNMAENAIPELKISPRNNSETPQAGTFLNDFSPQSPILYGHNHRDKRKPVAALSEEVKKWATTGNYDKLGQYLERYRLPRAELRELFDTIRHNDVPDKQASEDWVHKVHVIGAASQGDFAKVKAYWEGCGRFLPDEWEIIYYTLKESIRKNQTRDMQEALKLMVWLFANKPGALRSYDVLGMSLNMSNMGINVGRLSGY